MDLATFEIVVLSTSYKFGVGVRVFISLDLARAVTGKYCGEYRMK